LIIARLDLAENKPASAAQNLDYALALVPANAFGTALKRLRSGASGKATSQYL
jgi:hypothetical protein